MLVALGALSFSHAEEDPFAKDPFAKADRHPRAKLEEKAQVFKVSNPKNDKAELINVFEAVEKMETPKRNNSTLTMKVKQKINNREFLVSLGGDERYWLITLEDKNVADGDFLSIKCKKTENVREYASVMHANISVHEIVEVEDNTPIFSKELFVRRLKGGETWTLKGFYLLRCFKCGGSGKLGVLSNYDECTACGGRGGTKCDLLVTW